MATMQPSITVDVQRQLAEAVESLSSDDLGEEMADLLLMSVPEFDRVTDEDFRAGLKLSCAGNLKVLFGRLLDGATAAEPITPPADAAAWSRELVHRGLPLATLLRCYRLGHAFAEERIQDALAELDVPVEVRLELVAHVSRHAFAYVDAISTQLVDEYEQEHARWIRGAAAARAELVTAILEGGPVEVSVATERLRYDVSRRHVAMIVWADPADTMSRAVSLEGAAVELAATLGGGPVLSVPVGERVVWAWTSGEGVSDDPAAAGARLGGGLRAAVGSSASGIAGMADSHEDARATRRASELLATRPGSVLGYRSAALTGLLTADPARAVRFVETELGALGADNDAALRLRATVKTYLEESLSPGRTARRLSIHHNTVVYRIKQAEEILGHDVEQRRLELEAALRLAERLPALRSVASRETRA